MATSFQTPLRMRRRALPCLLSLVLLMGFTCGPAASAQADFQARADELVQAFHDAGMFEGAILMASGDEVLYERAVGYANRSWRAPNRPDTRFPIASITKQFAAALIHQLAEERLVDLDATVSATLPGYPAAQGRRVTLRQLLTHTSGIPDFIRQPQWDEIRRDPTEPAALIPVFSGLPLEFEPGTGFRYSNSNYILLGLIVEHVTGRTFMQAMQERLLTPLGLNDTGHADGTRVVHRLAQGYIPSPDGFTPEAYMSPSFPFAAGMLYSTNRDLLRWTRALHRAEPFQTPETLEAMLTPGRGRATGYASGIENGRKGFGPDTLAVIRHGGSIGGFYTEARYLPEREWTVVGYANTLGDIGGLADGLVRLRLGQEVELPRRPIGRVLGRVIEEEGIEAAVARYRTIAETTPDAYQMEEAELNALGYGYLGAGRLQIAIRLFRLNAEVFPTSWNVHDSLGEALATAGRTPEAILAYERSLELNPSSPSGAEALARLRAE